MNRHKIFAATAFALTGAALTAQQSLLPYLPENTLAVVSAPDLASCVEKFQATPLAKMWREEETQAFFGDVLELVNEEFQQGLMEARKAHEQGEFPIDPEQLLSLRLGGVTAALTRLDIGMGDFGPMPEVGLMVHIDFGSTPGLWNGLLQMGLGALRAEAGNDLVESESKIGDVQLLTFKPADAPPGMEMSLNLAMVPNGILVGTYTDEVTSTVEHMQAQKPLFGATELYAGMARHVDMGGSDFQSFIRFDPMVDVALSGLRMAAMMEPSLAMIDMDGLERALDVMGLRSLGAFAGTGSYVKGKSVARAYYAGERKGLLKESGKTIDMGFLRWVPKDAVGFSATTWNVSSLYDNLVKGLQAYDPEMAEMALGRLAKIEEQLGFSVRSDLFGSLGDHVISWQMPASTMTSMPESATLLKVNDEEKILKVLRSLAKLSDGLFDFEESERRGIKVNTIRINWDPSQGSGFNIMDMISPTFAFKDGYMVIAFTVGDIKRALKRMDREDDPSGDIRSNKEFAAIASSIPDGVSSVSFVDWKTNFESIYQLVTSALALVPMGDEVPIDMSLLPDPATLTQHLFAGVSFSKSSPDGVEYVSESPFGPELLVAVAAAAAAGGVLLSLGEMR